MATGHGAQPRTACKSPLPWGRGGFGSKLPETGIRKGRKHSRPGIIMRRFALAQTDAGWCPEKKTMVCRKQAESRWIVYGSATTRASRQASAISRSAVSEPGIVAQPAYIIRSLRDDELACANEASLASRDGSQAERSRQTGTITATTAAFVSAAARLELLFSVSQHPKRSRGPKRAPYLPPSHKLWAEPTACHSCFVPSGRHSPSCLGKHSTFHDHSGAPY